MLRWKRVYIIAHNNYHELPIDMGSSIYLLINILLGSFQFVLHSDQPLSGGEIIPFSGVCQSGEAALSTPESGNLLSRTDGELLMCNRRRPAAASSRRASFSALASS